MHLPKQVRNEITSWDFPAGLQLSPNTPNAEATPACVRPLRVRISLMFTGTTSFIYTILNYATGRKFFEDQPELLRRYERNEARYILQLPKNYDTINISFGIDKNEMKRLVIALAELDLTIDEWLCFKMNELVLADRLSKENRGEK